MNTNTMADTIPFRSELIQQIQRANRIATPWVLIQFVLALVLASQMDWAKLVDEPLFALIAVLVILGPHVMGILKHYALNKREISQLKEETRFGEFDKYQLRRLADETLDRLGLPRPGPPVYITGSAPADSRPVTGSDRPRIGAFLSILLGESAISWNYTVAGGAQWFAGDSMDWHVQFPQPGCPVGLWFGLLVHLGVADGPSCDGD